MFADDTNISMVGKSVTEFELIIKSEMKKLHQWLISSLKIAKTEFKMTGTRQRLWDGIISFLIRRKKHKAILIFKTINDLTPHYLRSTEYNLRK